MRTAEKVKPISTMQCPLTVMLLKNQPSKSGYANSSTFFTAARPCLFLFKNQQSWSGTAPSITMIILILSDKCKYIVRVIQSNLRRIFCEYKAA